jgi:hypothetical protein
MSFFCKRAFTVFGDRVPRPLSGGLSLSPSLCLSLSPVKPCLAQSLSQHKPGPARHYATPCRLSAVCEDQGQEERKGIQRLSTPNSAGDVQRPVLAGDRRF